MIDWPACVALIGIASVVTEYLWRIRMERQTMLKANALADRVEHLEQRMDKVPDLVRIIVGRPDEPKCPP